MFRIALAASLASLLAVPAPEAAAEESALDRKVRGFLESRRGSWRDLNVPWEDGQLLHDVVLKHRFTRALEIGTSTGHSSIWIAWALAKTGGRLITIEIDPERHRQALRNFEEAGVAPYIDARLADAHELVKQLPGPFDFAFSDADKGWYTQYFKDVDPKFEVGGCFTAHNVDMRGGAREFLEYVRTLPNYDTRVAGRGEGLSISCKTKRSASSAPGGLPRR
jgi:predicted O-methyltransferase YrrM